MFWLGVRAWPSEPLGTGFCMHAASVGAPNRSEKLSNSVLASPPHHWPSCCAAGGAAALHPSHSGHLVAAAVDSTSLAVSSSQQEGQPSRPPFSGRLRAKVSRGQHQRRTNVWLVGVGVCSGCGGPVGACKCVAERPIAACPAYSTPSLHRSLPKLQSAGCGRGARHLWVEGLCAVQNPGGG